MEDTKKEMGGVQMESERVLTRRRMHKEKTAKRKLGVEGGGFEKMGVLKGSDGDGRKREGSVYERWQISEDEPNESVWCEVLLLST